MSRQSLSITLNEEERAALDLLREEYEGNRCMTVRKLLDESQRWREALAKVRASQPPEG